MRSTQQIYQSLCDSFQVAPMDIFKHMTEQELKLDSYPLGETQTKPISFILPFLKDMRSVKMADCNLSDAAAALVVASVLGNSSTKVLDFRGIEMGEMFVASL